MRISILAGFALVAGFALISAVALIIMGLDGHPPWAVGLGIALIALNAVSITSLVRSYGTLTS